MADLVERLTEDCLPRTSPHVQHYKSPETLRAERHEAASEIERLRGLLVEARPYIATLLELRGEKIAKLLNKIDEALKASIMKEVGDGD